MNWLNNGVNGGIVMKKDSLQSLLYGMKKLTDDTKILVDRAIDNNRKFMETNEELIRLNEEMIEICDEVLSVLDDELKRVVSKVL
jgi:hypothetical protein